MTGLDFGFTEFLLVALPAMPALGAVVAGMCPSRATRSVQAIGWGSSIATLLVWILLRSLVSDGSGLLVSVRIPWVPDLGIGLHLGLDQTGIMMAGLVSLVGVVAVVGTLPSLPELSRSHIICLLLAETGMLGVVAAWDLILFIAFWEVTLVPFFFLMGRGPTRGGVTAASRFFIISVASSVIMWVGVLLVVNAAGLPRTFDLLVLSERLGRNPLQSFHSIWLLAPAFLVRMAAVPLHTWFPVAAANVPTAASIMLAGGVLPLGGYGLSHVLTRLFGPDLCGMSSGLVWIGVITALGGGLASVVQRDLKSLLAYVCLALVGLALVGLTQESVGGRQGGLTMLAATGIGGASLFLFSGVICQARGSQRIVDIGGLWRSHPFFAGLAFAGAASAAAVPGTIGFVGAAQVLSSISDNLVMSLLATSALLVVGASVIWVYRRVLGGSFQKEVWARDPWPLKRQASILALIALLALAVGLMPGMLSPSPKAGHIAAGQDAGGPKSGRGG